MKLRTVGVAAGMLALIAVLAFYVRRPKEHVASPDPLPQPSPSLPATVPHRPIETQPTGPVRIEPITPDAKARAPAQITAYLKRQLPLFTKSYSLIGPREYSYFGREHALGLCQESH